MGYEGGVWGMRVGCRVWGYEGEVWGMGMRVECKVWMGYEGGVWGVRSGVGYGV